MRKRARPSTSAREAGDALLIATVALGAIIAARAIPSPPNGTLRVLAFSDGKVRELKRFAPRALRVAPFLLRCQSNRSILKLDLQRYDAERRLWVRLWTFRRLPGAPTTDLPLFR